MLTKENINYEGNNNMEDTINRAYSEVYDILQHMEKVLIEKIPKSYIDMIYKNRDVRICCKYRLQKEY